MEVASLQRRHQFRRVSLAHCWTPRLGGKQKRGGGGCTLHLCTRFFAVVLPLPVDITASRKKELTYTESTRGERTTGETDEEEKVSRSSCCTSSLPTSPRIRGLRLCARICVQAWRALRTMRGPSISITNKQTNKRGSDFILCPSCSTFCSSFDADFVFFF